MNTIKNNEENEMIEKLEPEKRKRGRPRKNPDQPPIVRSKIRGQPKKYVNGETIKEIRFKRYENGYVYFAKMFYLKNKYVIPDELLNIKCDCIEDHKIKYFKWLEYVNNEKSKNFLNNSIYTVNKRKP